MDKVKLFHKVYADLIVKPTHRALWYEDGALTQILGDGRYVFPRQMPFQKLPKYSVVLVDMRERELTIKGQEILTADKVAIRVSIIARFRVIDPAAATHAVEDYKDRIYTDVQLAARRSLASMSLEEILTERNKLSDDILSDVQESAASYGVEIGRADVKDLIFPGNIQQIMNQALTAQRMAEAQIIQAQARADVERIEAQMKADAQQVKSEARAEETRLIAQAQADAQRLHTDAEVNALRKREQAAEAYGDHPALLRMLELETLREIAQSSGANTTFYFGTDLKLEQEKDGR